MKKDCFRLRRADRLITRIHVKCSKYSRDLWVTQFAAHCHKTKCEGAFLHMGCLNILGQRNNSTEHISFRKKIFLGYYTIHKTTIDDKIGFISLYKI